MKKKRTNLRWGVERRLEFIEFRLFWEGRVNRSDLIGTFGVSKNQASTDLNRYLEMAPSNMDYDKRVRAYLRTDRFKPKFLKLDAERYLTQIRSVADGIIEPDQSWASSLPAFDMTPNPARGIRAETLRTVVSAIRNCEAIEVKYQSLTRPEPRWRWIAPHALAFDGFRWHARAFCEVSNSFKDFLLSRMLETGEHRQA
ncbi:MAG TPA: WYL domain-containing transcriptional regulator, partial [Rhizobiales bacterium]|nr:WYL domain-containing transcriptional regulator [Hyphomicrobiales bacterium]